MNGASSTDFTAYSGIDSGYSSESSSGLDSPVMASARQSLDDGQQQAIPSCSGTTIALPRADVSAASLKGSSRFF